MKKLILILTCAVMAFSAIYAQDIIVTKDSKKIDAKILEVSTSEIRYKELDNLNGPIFILRADEINSITYANGKVVQYNQQDLAESREQDSIQPLSEEEMLRIQQKIDALKKALKELLEKAEIEGSDGENK